MGTELQHQSELKNVWLRMFLVFFSCETGLLFACPGFQFMSWERIVVCEMYPYEASLVIHCSYAAGTLLP